MTKQHEILKTQESLKIMLRWAYVFIKSIWDNLTEHNETVPYVYLLSCTNRNKEIQSTNWGPK